MARALWPRPAPRRRRSTHRAACELSRRCAPPTSRLRPCGVGVVGLPLDLGFHAEVLLPPSGATAWRALPDAATVVALGGAPDLIGSTSTSCFRKVTGRRPRRAPGRPRRPAHALDPVRAGSGRRGSAVDRRRPTPPSSGGRTGIEGAAATALVARGVASRWGSSRSRSVSTARSSSSSPTNAPAPSPSPSECASRSCDEAASIGYWRVVAPEVATTRSPWSRREDPRDRCDRIRRPACRRRARRGRTRRHRHDAPSRAVPR